MATFWAFMGHQAVYAGLAAYGVHRAAQRLSRLAFWSR